jgi:hypothetical protein
MFVPGSRDLGANAERKLTVDFLTEAFNTVVLRGIHLIPPIKPLIDCDGERRRSGVVHLRFLHGAPRRRLDFAALYGAVAGY